MTNSIIQDIEKEIDRLYAEREEQEQRRRRAVQAGNNHVYEVGYSHSWMEYTSIANSELAAKERISEIDREIRELYTKLWLENQKISNVQR
jgi:predicted DsbA family dithiol-disulfide isomerase